MTQLRIKNRKAARLPDKTTMNLFVREKTDNSLSRVLPVAIVLVLLVALISRFGVVERLRAVSRARAELRASQEALETYTDALVGFGTVREEYFRYSQKYMDEAEVALFDRLALLDILEAKAGGLVQLESVSVGDNVAIVTVRANTLKDVATFKEALEADAAVRNVMAYNADTTAADELTAEFVTASLAVEVFDAKKEAAQ